MLKLLSSTAHTIHHANPSPRVGSNPVKTTLFKALSQLTGWNHELGRRRAFCSNQSDAAADPKSDASNPEASDTKSSSSVVVSTTTTSLDDYQTVIALPLPKKPLFPGFYMPIYVKDRKLIEALQESMRRQTPYAGAFLLKDDEASADSSSSSSTCETENVLEKFKGKELLNRMHEVGTLAQISSIQGEQVILIGRRRLRITDMVSEDPLSVKVEHIKNKAYDKDDDVIKATYFEVMSTLRDVLKTTSLWRDQHIGDFNYQHLADFGAGISSANKHENQGVLEELDVHKRLELALDLLKKEVEVNKIQASIAKTVEEKFSGERRQIVLKEQLKAIKKELGVETDSKSAFSEKFKERIEVNKDKIPKHVLKVIEEHLTKLQLLEPTSSEFDVTLNYLDWLTVLPWGNISDENFDVLKAEKILDEDHYGLSDVKERILEFIAVGSLRGTSQGKIICLSGPPGVGKTSIGRSIARALDRKFFRFSVGGLSDVAEINGHRRTYIGAIPGKLVQCLKTVGTENPIILIDEIDKLGKGHSGDPASALLEVMDPEQNANFRDHYLDVTIDLSKVLFVCTANVIDTIPKPLLDRMEVISLAGYITDEKLHIARDFLVKNTCRDCGIKPEQVDMSDAALLSLIENYCREAGTSAEGSTVLTDESATKTEQSEVVAEKVMIEESNLADYLGKPVFHSDKIYEKTPVGVVMGLAWTSMGGSTLYIETTFVEEVERKGRLRITGQLGSVMKESAQIAHTVARRIMLEKEPDNLFLANSKLHLHVPEGATPKDGPSAGCTMITSLLSLAMKKPVRKDLAMTGEVTLTGRILPIGGVKEKTIAARRSQVKMIIFPEANRKDFDELPENVKEGLDVHFVDEYEQIFELAFGLQFLITAEGARTVEHVSSLLMAEALAMREAMQEASALIDQLRLGTLWVRSKAAKRTSLLNVWFCTDSQELARAINSKTYPMEFSGVLMDIELLSSSFVFYYVSFIGRELNGIADALAKSALDSSVSTL
ncbi:hypothetical protein F2Q68_00033166 [Brassica cretica]|uniref:Lon protease homolog, mitochondrial n=2 Tax=Brassica cretica TaxID=69181 RepID=A0A8S9G864_BRACR|nr:hypothetical protein F2Q68_00033166 [Brassica cretica]